VNSRNEVRLRFLRGLKWVVTESDTPKAIRLRDDYRSGVHELTAPEIFPYELAHALTRAERQGRIPVADAAVRLTDVLTTCPMLILTLPLLPRATDISSRTRVGVYDCLYVALAEQQGSELITADARLINVLRPMFPFIVDLASLP
jgi:predicted nucleic acid-binding protein